MTNQHQGSTQDQLKEAIVLCDKAGLYDAADVIRGLLLRDMERSKK